jgi:hypothetical protein
MTFSKGGKTYETRVGSRVQVARGKAYMTSGGLKASDISFNSKTGRYVSKRKSAWGKKHGKKQLERAGYGLFTKGSPGTVRKIRKQRRA